MAYLIRELVNYQHVGDYMKENIAVKSIENIWQDPQCFCISEFIRDEFFLLFQMFRYCINEERKYSRCRISWLF